MEKETSKKQKIVKKLKNKFRLVVMNDDTFEQKFSLILSPLNVFAWGGTIVILLIITTAAIISFTPLKEFIPGYADVNTRHDATYAAMKADSLQVRLNSAMLYIENIRAIMQGKATNERIADTISGELIETKYVVSEEDSLLRKKIEEEEQFNIQKQDNSIHSKISSYMFFTPLNGLVSQSFNAKEEHYGVDVIAKKDEAVKATLDGTVVLATWTAETGHIIQIQHENNLISVYKHNSVLMKKVGDHVKSGEVIAIVGESGEQTTGPHLHFELWYDGKPIDPQEFMIF